MASSPFFGFDMHSSSSITIYQTFHKSYLHNKACTWLQPVGVNGYVEEGFISDADGDHISSLNPYFCELTAQYWVWKNSSASVVGFYHYRRYMNYLIDGTWSGDYGFSVPASQQVIDYLTQDNQKLMLERMLRVSDVVIPSRYSSGANSIEQHYTTHHQPEHWAAFLEAIARRFPQDTHYLDLFRLTNQNTAFNMFVMRRELYNAYCEDLFAVLMPLFEQFGRNYGEYNNRYPGFLAERFLAFWIQKHGLRTFEVPMMMLT